MTLTSFKNQIRHFIFSWGKADSPEPDQAPATSRPVTNDEKESAECREPSPVVQGYVTVPVENDVAESDAYARRSSGPVSLFRGETPARVAKVADASLYKSPQDHRSPEGIMLVSAQFASGDEQLKQLAAETLQSVKQTLNACFDTGVQNDPESQLQVLLSDPDQSREAALSILHIRKIAQESPDDGERAEAAERFSVMAKNLENVTGGDGRTAEESLVIFAEKTVAVFEESRESGTSRVVASGTGDGSESSGAPTAVTTASSGGEQGEGEVTRVAPAGVSIVEPAPPPPPTSHSGGSHTGSAASTQSPASRDGRPGETGTTPFFGSERGGEAAGLSMASQNPPTPFEADRGGTAPQQAADTSLSAHPETARMQGARTATTSEAAAPGGRVSGNDETLATRTDQPRAWVAVAEPQASQEPFPRPSDQGRPTPSWTIFRTGRPSTRPSPTRPVAGRNAPSRSPRPASPAVRSALWAAMASALPTPRIVAAATVPVSAKEQSRSVGALARKTGNPREMPVNEVSAMVDPFLAEMGALGLGELAQAASSAELSARLSHDGPTEREASTIALRFELVGPAKEDSIPHRTDGNRAVFASVSSEIMPAASGTSLKNPDLGVSGADETTSPGPYILRATVKISEEVWNGLPVEAQSRFKRNDRRGTAGGNAGGLATLTDKEREERIYELVISFPVPPSLFYRPQTTEGSLFVAQADAAGLTQGPLVAGTATKGNPGDSSGEETPSNSGGEGKKGGRDGGNDGEKGGDRNRKRPPKKTPPPKEERRPDPHRAETVRPI